MRGDSSANKALGLLGAKNAALVTAIDSLGDVYQYAVFATVLADLHVRGRGHGAGRGGCWMRVVDGGGRAGVSWWARAACAAGQELGGWAFSHLP